MNKHRPKTDARSPQAKTAVHGRWAHPQGFGWQTMVICVRRTEVESRTDGLSPSIEAGSEFYLRWLKNSVIEIRKLVWISLIFNHLNRKPSKNWQLLAPIIIEHNISCINGSIIVFNLWWSSFILEGCKITLSKYGNRHDSLDRQPSKLKPFLVVCLMNHDDHSKIR